MSPDVPNPHDRFFRQVWSHTEITADFLANYLPPSVAAMLDLGSLHLEPDRYVDERLSDQRSDLLYSVALAGGGRGFVYVLFEHKSYADPHVAVQLLRYMGAIWDQYLKGEDASGGGIRRLPLIIPLVFYHGADRWEPRRLGTLMASVPEALGEYVPDFEFVVSDFSAPGSPEFRGGPLLRALLQVFHTLPGGNLREELERIMLLWKGLTEEPIGRGLFRAVLEYFFRVDDSVTVDEVSEAARTAISAREGEEAMTIAERLQQQGEKIGQKRGEKIGEKRGEKLGIQKGQTALLLRLLTTRFGELPHGYQQRLEQADSETLLTWSERILTAKTIDDVFEP